MRKIVILSIFIVIIMFAANGYAFTASYDQVITGSGSEESMKRVIKIKDNKMRIEMDWPDGKRITIIDGKTLYSYIPAKNTAIKIVSKSSPEMSVLSDYESYLSRLDAKVTGSEKIDGYECDIYEYVDPRTDLKSKLWLWKSKKFPIKIEAEMQDGVMTTIMKDVEVGIRIADSEFALPDGVEIKDVSSLMKQGDKQQ